MKKRNLSLCPITPDPPELLELIAELKEYMKTVDFDNIAIYEAVFRFEYKGVEYRMDSSVLSTGPDVMWKASELIEYRLKQLGASNITFMEMMD